MTFQELFYTAKWMTPTADCLTPLCRARFAAPSAQKATLTICGLGFFKAFLNGRPVSPDLFVPLNTNYHARAPFAAQDGSTFAEQMTTRIIVPQYDVTDLVQAGENTLAVRLGPGYYNYDHSPAYGPVRLAFVLEMTAADGSVTRTVSDESLRWHKSEVVKAEFTRGEEHDYTGFDDSWADPACDDSGWLPMVESPVPATRYELMQSPADRIIRTLVPVCIYACGDTKVYDIGENIAGRPIVRCGGGESATVTVRVAEERTAEGRLDEKSVQELYGQHLTVHTDGQARTVTLRSTWLAGRYFEVTGNAEMVAFEEIHADVAVTARFASADPVANWLFEAYLRTQLANMHGGIPSDCPHIERRGYTGDGQLAGEAAMQLLDGKAFYRKWLDDISDCQDRTNGHVQYTAPYVPSGGGPGGWGCAIVEVPYTFWRVYGDKGPLLAMYPQMLRWFDYLDAHSEAGLVVSDQPGCWCLGDWCTAEKTAIPEPYVNNYFYAKSLRRVLTFAPEADRPMLTARLEKVLAAITANYYDQATGSFCGGIQGADAYAVDLGLGDERTLHNLVAQYKALGTYDTGIFGTDILTRVLFEKGEAELAWALLTNRGPWGFGNWMRQGATTLWEYWTGERSHSHPMFGAAARYLHQYVLGIRQGADSAGYAQLTVAPVRLPGLAFAKGSLATPRGEIAVDWARLDDRLHITVTLPAGVSCPLVWNGRTYPLQGGKNRLILPF